MSANAQATHSVRVWLMSFAVLFALSIAVAGTAQGAPTAAIYTTPNTMKIAPYTALVSGVGSTSDVEIVRWQWDFGDTGSADPATDEGMLAAHRFDSADTYTVSLTVTDANGLTDSTSAQVTADAFSGTTYYVSSSDGDDGYDGLGPGTPWRTMEYAVANMGGSQNNPNRLLLKRGDYWLCDEGGYGNLHMIEPSILDAYGTGSAPMIEFTYAGDDTHPCMYIYNNSGEFGYGVILNNLHLYHAQEHYCSALITAYSRGCVVRNCTLENGGISGTAQQFGLTVEDCDITDCRHQGIFTSGDDVICRRTSIAGNGTDNILDHPIYWSHGYCWLIDDCVLDGQNRDQCNFATKLRAGWDVLVRNTVATGTRNGFAAGRNESDAIGDETDNVIFDRCISHHNGTSGQASGFYLGPVSKIIIRNCLVYQVDPAPDYGIGGVSMVGTDGSPTTDIRIYNNTFYSVGVPNLRINGDHAVDVKNNIFFKDVDEKPGRYGFYTIDDSGACTVDSDYNCFYWIDKTTTDDSFAIDNGSYLNISWDEWRSSYGQDANSTWDDALFADAESLDFHLQTGSPCREAGTDLPLVWQDMDQLDRPQASAWDVGAYEYEVTGNEPPTAYDDSYGTDEDVTLNVATPGVLANDTDPEEDPLTAIKVSDPSDGSLTLYSNGSFTYDPDQDFNGQDSFTYKANDGTSDSNVATVTVTVDAVNDPPVANDDSYSTDEDTTLDVGVPGVLGNDSDVDEDALGAIKVSDPSHGGVTLNSDGSFSYTPDTGYTGDDSFTYKANDGTADSSVATVNITVNPGNQPPVASDDAYTAQSGRWLRVSAPGVLGNDSDPESDPLEAILVSDVSHGRLTLDSDGSFDYKSDNKYTGEDSFTYKANDGQADSNVATVTITVQ